MEDELKKKFLYAPSLWKVPACTILRMRNPHHIAMIIPYRPISMSYQSSKLKTKKSCLDCRMMASSSVPHYMLLPLQPHPMFVRVNGSAFPEAVRRLLPARGTDQEVSFRCLLQRTESLAGGCL